MKWNHLPEPGGLYDQNPKLIDRFYYILQAQAQQQESEARKEQREAERRNKTGQSSRSTRRR